MAFTPAPPNPKSTGDIIRSSDWNELTKEVQRLEKDKVNKSGDTINGTLSVSQALNVGTTASVAGTKLQILDSANPAVVRIQSSAAFGSTELQFWSDPRGSTNEWRPAYIKTYDQGSFTGALAFITNGTGTANKQGSVEAMRITNGKVGIGFTSIPDFKLEIADRIRIRQGASGTAGLWLYQNTPADHNRAFIGMNGDDIIGFWGNGAAAWGLNMHVTTLDVGIGTSPNSNGRLVVNGNRIGQVQSGTFGDVGSQWCSLGMANLGVPPNANDVYGLKVSWNTDSVIIGLKDYGSNRKDAVIQWGDDSNDNLRFVSSSGTENLVLNTDGKVNLANSEIYFTNTNHNHTGFGNNMGYAAIENTKDYDALMILGRQTATKRVVKLWDYLEVYGVAAKTGGGSWATISDKRLKTNINPISGALDKLISLQGVTFEWKEPQKMGAEKGSIHMGMIAQDVKNVFPEWVTTHPDGNLMLNITGFEAVVIESIKELYKIIMDLKKEIGAETTASTESKKRKAK